MTPGALWYADFSKPHSHINATSQRRIHLLIDMPITKNILKLFPDKVIKKIGKENIVFLKKPYFIAPKDLKHYECDFMFYVGRSLFMGAYSEGSPLVVDEKASIRLVKNELVLFLKNEPYVALYPVSKTEFYFVAGTPAYTIKFSMSNNQVKKISFVMNKGSMQTIVQMPLVNTK